VWRAVLKTLVFTLVVPGTVTYVVPRWLLGSRSLLDLPPGARPIGLMVLLAGTAIYFWCAWDFAAAGRGTPAPTDPPKELVARGLYRYVRNPMYVGISAILLGEALFWRSRALLKYTVAVFGLFFLFIVVYEEPTLQQKFGETYERYRRDVPRWIPRFKRNPGRSGS